MFVLDVLVLLVLEVLASTWMPVISLMHECPGTAVPGYLNLSTACMHAYLVYQAVSFDPGIGISVNSLMIEFRPSILLSSGLESLCLAKPDATRESGITELTRSAARYKVLMSQVADFADHKDIATSRGYDQATINTRAALSNIIGQTIASIPY